MRPAKMCPVSAGARQAADGTPAAFHRGGRWHAALPVRRFRQGLWRHVPRRGWQRLPELAGKRSIEPELYVTALAGRSAPGHGLARDRVRGGHERPGAMVDVGHHALGALEQDALVVPVVAVEAFGFTRNRRPASRLRPATVRPTETKGQPQPQNSGQHCAGECQANSDVDSR